MEELYQNAPGPNPPQSTQGTRFRGVSYTTAINAAKEAVPTVDLADRLCLESGGKWKRVGNKWVTNCLLPDHEDKQPSFVVYTETNSWYCHGCHRGGDVVKLAQLAWGYTERDSHIAAAEVLMEFGHEVPQRPPAWFRRQQRQCDTRRRLEEVKARSARRRLMRMFLPLLSEIEDERERQREAQLIWQDLEEVARLLVRGGGK